MAEILVDFDAVLVGSDGKRYGARACGRGRPDGLWEGWVEFPEEGGSGVLRTGRETTQPNRDDLMYWATGLTAAYLDGALLRTLTPAPPVAPRESTASRPSFEGPAERTPVQAPVVYPHAVLDPYQVYAEGDEILRGQLKALSASQLRTIVRAYQMSNVPLHTLERLSAVDLIGMIMRAVEERARA
jgi:hypothetical protein